MKSLNGKRHGLLKATKLSIKGNRDQFLKFDIKITEKSVYLKYTARFWFEKIIIITSYFNSLFFV